MKTTMKAVTMVLMFNLGTAFADDPVIKQINVTQDAVKVALEELEQGKLSIQPGADIEAKMNTFTADASKALLKFEEAVRVRVLQSLSTIVAQYNRTYSNFSLGGARIEILRNLRTQMMQIQTDKSQIYREAYLELYSVLPDFPIAFDHIINRRDSNYSFVDNEWVKDNPVCISVASYCSGKTRYFYEGNLYWSRSQSKPIKFNMIFKDSEKSKNNVAEFLTAGNAFTMDKARTILLQGCYTSTCYFLTQSQYTIWKTMVETTLARNITIELADGNEIVITKNISRLGKSEDAITPFLNGISSEGLINSLPTESSPERIKILTDVNAQLEKGSCRSARKTAENLCHTTREGCLSQAEVNLFKDRHGDKASCLK